MPGISIIMPARNAGTTIEASVRSVLAAPEVEELLVMENWSTDNTAEVLAGIDDPRLKVFDKPEEKYPNTLNTLMMKARYPYLGCCDSDDNYLPDRLPKQIAWMEAHPDYAATSAAYMTIDTQDAKIAELATEGEPRDVTDIFLGGKAITHFGTFVYRTDAVQKTGGFRDWFASCPDIDFLFRVAEQGRIWHDPTLMSFQYRLHDSSITHSLGNARRKFFDNCATEFALQRAKTGQDDLMRGTPPTPPEHDGAVRSSATQIAGQLEGQAWRSLEAGDKSEALSKMIQSIKAEPGALRRWAGLAKMVLRSPKA